MPGDPPQQPTDETVVLAPTDDPRLASATARAHRRLPEFIELLRQRPSGVWFYVKAAFRRTDGREDKGAFKHMWVRVDALEDGVFIGSLDNDPQGATAETLGTPVRIPAADIEDWYYDRGGKKYVGGFSIPVLDQIERERNKSK